MLPAARPMWKYLRSYSSKLWVWQWPRVRRVLGYWPITCVNLKACGTSLPRQRLSRWLICHFYFCLFYSLDFFGSFCIKTKRIIIQRTNKNKRGILNRIPLFCNIVFFWFTPLNSWFLYCLRLPTMLWCFLLGRSIDQVWGL